MNYPKIGVKFLRCFFLGEDFSYESEVINVESQLLLIIGPAGKHD